MIRFKHWEFERADRFPCLRLDRQRHWPRSEQASGHARAPSAELRGAPRFAPRSYQLTGLYMGPLGVTTGSGN